MIKDILQIVTIAVFIAFVVWLGLSAPKLNTKGKFLPAVLICVNSKNDLFKKVVYNPIVMTNTAVGPVWEYYDEKGRLGRVTHMQCSVMPISEE